jgi:HK97 family phage portal protein
MAHLSGGATVKAITHIPGWALESDSAGRVSNASAAYERIPLIRRGVDILADSVVQVPHRIETAAGKDGEWPFSAELDGLLKATVASYLIEGAAYWLKLRNRIRNAGVQWLNPTTMRVEFAGRRADGSVGLKFTQNADKVLTWDETQIVYFRQWHLRDDITPGKSVVQCVLEAANLTHHMTRFAKTFFEQGAQPVVIIGAPPGAAETEVEKAETFFRRLMTGVNNAFRVLATKNIWEMKVVTPPIDTLAMPELSAYARQQVAIGMGIPETMLSDAANYATAAQHDTQFWKNTILPLCNLLAGVINKSLLEPMGLKLCFYAEEMDVFQEDETERADSLASLVGTGMRLGYAMQTLGYELTREELSYDDLDALEEAISKPKQAPPPMIQPVIPERTDVTPPAGQTEMRRWARWFEKNFKPGKSMRPFETEHVPASLKAAIEGALETVTTVDGARQVFADALRYP